LWSLVVVAAVNTAISLYYYVGIIRIMFLADDAERPPVAAPIGGLAMVNVCAIVLLLLGTLWINPLKNLSHRFAERLAAAPVAEQIVQDTAGDPQPPPPAEVQLTAATPDTP
jgi:hypothetical protein